MPAGAPADRAAGPLVVDLADGGAEDESEDEGGELLELFDKDWLRPQPAACTRVTEVAAWAIAVTVAACVVAVLLLLLPAAPLLMAIQAWLLDKEGVPPGPAAPHHGRQEGDLQQDVLQGRQDGDQRQDDLLREDKLSMGGPTAEWGGEGGIGASFWPPPLSATPQGEVVKGC